MGEFEIKSNCLYTKEALAQHLKGIVNIDVFLRRLRPRHVFKNAWYGRDILTALGRSSSGADEHKSDSLDYEKDFSGGRRRRGKAPAIPLEKILIK